MRTGGSDCKQNLNAFFLSCWLTLPQLSVVSCLVYLYGKQPTVPGLSNFWLMFAVDSNCLLHPRTSLITPEPVLLHPGVDSHKT
ncbi:mCG148287 [Mus musculus]|nr:mCG148287 [Mus musculus]